MTFGTVSWLDVVLVFMLCASIGFGFHQGLVRQVVLVVAIYIATILAAQYNYAVSSVLVSVLPDSNPEMLRVMAFVVLLGVFAVIITWSVWITYRQTRLPSVLFLDGVGGTLLGCLIGLFAISITLTLAQYVLDSPWPQGSPIRQILHIGITNSGLQGAFSSPLPLIRAAIRPWLPDGIPDVLGS